MKPIIEVRNLSKQYKIGQKQKYLSLRDSVMDFFKFKAQNTEKTDFWALDDVSFDVYPGESIGIIGKNGAGKSTLLKILSRITPPTKGSVILRGRMASLLEVGTGFHQELSGRENIYFNGSILGLRKAEIAKKFDEIVAFSGVEQFIDTPLKHYSSGMQLRLAFAVAAHLEPEILVIDEVLAVGDAEFQKKCLGKMDEVSKSGRTVLFVSHNLGVVKNLCKKGILLENGYLRAIDSVNLVVNKYLQSLEKNNELFEWQTSNDQKFQNEYFEPIRFALIDKDLKIAKSSLSNDRAIGVLIESNIKTINPSLTMGIAIYTITEELLFWAYQTDKWLMDKKTIKNGINRWVAWIPPHFLNEGEFIIELIGGIHNQFWILEPKKNTPRIKLIIKEGLSNSPYWTSARPGLLAPHIDFEFLNNYVC